MPALLVERDEVGVGDLADVEVLHGLLGEGEEPGAEAVALVGLAVDEAVLVEGAQQPQRGGLVDAEPVGDLSQVGGALGEQRQDAQRAVDGLAHGVRTSSWARLRLCVQPGPSRSVPHAVVVEGGQAVGVRRGPAGAARSPGTVRAAAAMRWPCRSAVPDGQAAQGGGEEPGGEGVAGADGAPRRRRAGRGRRWRTASARGGPSGGAWNTVAPALALLDDQDVRAPAARRGSPGPPCRPQAAPASSSPTKTRSAPRASSSRTPGPAPASRHRPAR